ncbi:dienelactone hydrolase family protein [Pseudomonas oleovorans]|uniref:Dienelactone hydrolase family protein n=1 Tax=Ectopseudomonas oleovorans TaxID=301 RepID=A0AB35KXF1_ECTOL|nr:dienelactone hydrolase family protein [Pseudomonas oleovorans]MCR1826344.1 dienelactone hydrolase family protein [Pseudomonas oleovorans]MDH0567543.1 dienelactone hydrolase family protein [Pseudomonas oleovorans]
MAVRIRTSIKTLAAALLLAPWLAWATPPEAVPVTKRLVAFETRPLPSFGDLPALRVSAVLSVPARAAGKVPAVVILHGSAGMDSRGVLHGADLNAQGIATLELDMWGARGLAGGAAQRPTRVHDTLPDLAGALAFLAQHLDIDAGRIGAIGFSWGGVQAMLAATAPIHADLQRASGVRLGALAAFYPVCWGYNRVPGYDFRELAPVRLLVLTGSEDQYDDDPQACPSLLAALSPAARERVTVKVFAGAQHGFNGLEPAQQYEDPFLHRGKGGLGLSAPDPEARAASQAAVVALFREVFGRLEAVSSERSATAGVAQGG